ncbi:MAG: helix-turn-helix transcriptional regulator [Verrucomicrobia bacterium]|nr:helix-turn-helix transcriptional regulator [Verrucomicrobiota bacterium]MDA1068994.1 helix-turn-helix transcriptional regulator [Verrucomicrobiota bacterium]
MWPLKTKKEIAAEIANRCRDLRLEQNLSQEELAKRSGIVLRTYRRFEQEGSISLERLVGVIQSLNRISELETILRPSPFADLDQIENPKPARKRSRSR